METLTLPWRIFPKKIEAACYNRGRLALLRLGYPLRVTLQQHRGLEVILRQVLCGYVLIAIKRISPFLAWREFQIRGRRNLHLPVSCELWLYHSCAGLIMGSALDDLDQALEKIMH
jgi:hypothetical protein